MPAPETNGDEEGIPATAGVKRSAEEALGDGFAEVKRWKTEEPQIIDDSAEGAIVIDDD